MSTKVGKTLEQAFDYLNRSNLNGGGAAYHGNKLQIMNSRGSTFDIRDVDGRFYVDLTAGGKKWFEDSIEAALFIVDAVDSRHCYDSVPG